MKNLLLCCLLCGLTAPASGQQAGPQFFTADSLQNTARLLTHWVCKAGDNLHWAAPEYDDSGWPPAVFSRIDLKADSPIRFRGIAWFRKRIQIDSSLVGVPLALQMNHQGASQIFLDGHRLFSYGVLVPRDSADYYNPQNDPDVFLFQDTGWHLLAVRYADWRSQPEKKRWSENTVSFDLNISHAEYAVASKTDRLTGELAAFFFLAVLFGTLSFIHLVLWLYYRPARSNLPFSLFSASLAALLVIVLLITTSCDPAKIIRATRAAPFVSLLAIVSLSGFINTLFGRRKWRFRAVIVVGLVSAGLIFLPFETILANLLPVALFVLVLLETVVLTVGAILRRVPGARIIGAGVLLFSVLILTGVAISVIGRVAVRINPNDSPITFWLTVASILAIPVSMSVFLAWNFATINKRLEAELQHVETLSEKARAQEEERQRLLENRQEELEREVNVRTEQLRGEKQKSDDLLLNILPAEIAEELKEKGSAQTRLYNNVSVLFTDFVDFTIASSTTDPVALVQEIDDCFRAFDEIVTRHGLEKIKTIGDAYMAVAGLPAAHPGHANATVAAALDIRDFIRRRRTQNPGSFAIRIGIHSGPVVAGIVGVKKFAYDVWGDTVNTAARMEQGGEAGRVNISQSTYELVKEEYRCEKRGMIAVKGKGEVEMYFVEKSRAGETIAG